MQADNLMNLVILGIGIYMIYNAITMKVNHKIPSALVGKEIKLDQAKDKEGFIKKMFPYTLGIGIMAILCSLSARLEVLQGEYIQVIISIVCLVIMLIYIKIFMDAQKKFLSNS